MSAPALRPTPPSKLWPTVWLSVSAIVVVAAIWAVDAKWARLLDLPGSFVN